MSEMSDAARVADVRHWVEWLIPAYEIAEWPDCWASHSALVREVEALRRWQIYTLDPKAASAEAFQWHEGLGRFRLRLRVVNRQCTGGCASPREGGSGGAGEGSARVVALHSKRAAGRAP